MFSLPFPCGEKKTNKQKNNTVQTDVILYCNRQKVYGTKQVYRGKSLNGAISARVSYRPSFSISKYFTQNTKIDALKIFMNPKKKKGKIKLRGLKKKTVF